PADDITGMPNDDGHYIHPSTSLSLIQIILLKIFSKSQNPPFEMKNPDHRDPGYFTATFSPVSADSRHASTTLRLFIVFSIVCVISLPLTMASEKCSTSALY